MLDTLELGPADHASACVIWLHGLGADGHDFASAITALDLPQLRFVLPHAPYRAVTINNGHRMRAWYDLYGLERGSRQDADGLRQSQGEIEALIAAEKAGGMPAGRIVLAGFSQGGALALHTALRHPEPLAGLLALSTYLPLQDALDAEAHAANRDLAIFMAHGSFDPIIAPQTARLSAQWLEERRYPLSWHEYPMAHTVCHEELRDIRSFLVATLDL